MNQINQTNQNHSAKFAFFYMLSLVALVFTGLSVGMIVFQLINKYIPDIANIYQGSFSADLLRFGISALIIAAPLYFIVSRLIYKNLYTGVLDKDAAVRKWLTYFILLASSVLMLGWLIAIINNFLNGELTLKFILKAVSSIIIALIAFSFYLYDIKREQVANVKSNIIRLYFWGSLIIIVAVFTSALFIIETPKQARDRKIDTATINSFSQIDIAINDFYKKTDKMPESLAQLMADTNYLNDRDIKDVETNEIYQYQVLGEKKYQLCAFFRTSNQDDLNSDYYNRYWPHQAGEQCIEQDVLLDNSHSEPVQLVP